MNTANASLGLIAGNRSLPLEFARQARAAGVKRLVAVAFEKETDAALAGLVDEIVWLRVGQLSKMISAFTDRGIQQCVMVGQIAPKNLYDLRPDLRAMSVLLRLKEKNAHTIFGAIADELKQDGVELVEATPWLKPLMPQAGFQLGNKLSAGQQADVNSVFVLPGKRPGSKSASPSWSKTAWSSPSRDLKARTNASRAGANWRAGMAARWP